MGVPVHETRMAVRSYELDSFGHVNHAVYLNYFEHARFQALTQGGFDLSTLERRGEGVHVVRVEVDYRRELGAGREFLVRTRVAEARNSSMTLAQTMVDPVDPTLVFAEAQVVVVWIGPEGRPIRIPDDVRAGLGIASAGAA